MYTLQDEFPKWANMASLFVFCICFEYLLEGALGPVEISLETRCHAKVIDEQRMLIDVLKNAEFPFFDR